MEKQDYTVFAVYRCTFQPYATSVAAEGPEEAVRLAQLEAVLENGGEPNDYEGFLDSSVFMRTSQGYAEINGDFGDYTLAGIQVARGVVEVVL